MFSLNQLLLLTTALLTAVHADGTLEVINSCTKDVNIDSGTVATISPGESRSISFGDDAVSISIYTTDANKNYNFEAETTNGRVSFDVSSSPNAVPVETYSLKTEAGCDDTCPSGAKFTFRIFG